MPMGFRRTPFSPFFGGIAQKMYMDLADIYLEGADGRVPDLLTFS